MMTQLASCYTIPAAYYTDKYLCDPVDWSTCISQFFIAHGYNLASFTGIFVYK